jgi:LysR family hydrogen peroxide-inducible transcriptional activator
MTRSQIEYILAVHKLKNFSKAAESCFITQSTLSAMVAKFEESTRVTLFNRKTKPISTTEEGEVLIKQLQNIRREFQILDDTIGQLKGFQDGQINLACIPTVAPFLLPLILTDIAAHFPSIKFKIHEMTTPEVIRKLLSGDIDIGIVSTPLNQDDLEEHPLYKEEFLLLDYGNEAKSPTYKIEDIDIDRLWLLEEGHCLRNQVNTICQLRSKKKVNSNISYSTGSIYSVVEMVKEQKGVTLLPYLAIEKNLQVDKAHLFSFNEPIPSREIGIVTHKHFVKQKILNDIIEIIQNQIQQKTTLSAKEKYRISPY